MGKVFSLRSPDSNVKSCFGTGEGGNFFSVERGETSSVRSGRRFSKHSLSSR